MVLSAFTFFHVVLSLAGIGAGLGVLYGLINRKPMDSWHRWFLWTTVATSVTGFMFPVHQFMPAHGVGMLSLMLLAVAIYARSSKYLAGVWSRTYTVTGMLALYLNVFVLFVQLFQKVPPLHALAPTQSEPAFQLTQLTVLVVFMGLIVLATIRSGHGAEREWNKRTSAAVAGRSR